MPKLNMQIKTTLLNNRYKILETLGRGGFGETFLATDTHLPSRRKCVIKQLKPVIQEPNLPQWMKDRFQREAAILEQLGEASDQIPRLHAYFEEKGHFYLVQEWIEGVTLTQQFKQQGIFSEKEVKDILLKLLPVLDFIHSKRIVHRDLKPDNIILRKSDRLPVLIDFGAVKEAMATVVNVNTDTALSMAIGTPGYMSSEQAAGRPVYSSDLYSLGLTAVYLLTGKSPYTLETDSRTGEILWRKEVGNIDPNLAEVIDRSVRFHPRDRFASATEMLQALQVSTVKTNAATVAVAPGNLPSRRKPTTQPLTRNTFVVTEPSNEATENNWFKFFLPLLLVGGIGITTFVVGYNLFASKESPSDVVSSTTREQDFPPQDFPSESKPNFRERLKPNLREKTPDVVVETKPKTPTETASESNDATITTPETSPENNPDPSSSETPKTSPPINSNTNTTTESAIASKPTPTPTPTVTSPPSKPLNQTTMSGISVPVFRVGSSKTQLRENLGEPTSTSKGYWGDSNAWLYSDIVPGQVDLGYIFDTNTGKLRQTEVSFANSVGLPVMEKTLNNLLGGNAPSVVKQALQEVYQRQTDLRSFQLGNYKGMIQRNQKDRIYIGVWDHDFH